MYIVNCGNGCIANFDGMPTYIGGMIISEKSVHLPKPDAHTGKWPRLLPFGTAKIGGVTLTNSSVEQSEVILLSPLSDTAGKQIYKTITTGLQGKDDADIVDGFIEAVLK